MGRKHRAFDASFKLQVSQAVSGAQHHLPHRAIAT